MTKKALSHTQKKLLYISLTLLSMQLQIGLRNFFFGGKTVSITKSSKSKFIATPIGIQHNADFKCWFYRLNMEVKKIQFRFNIYVHALTSSGARVHIPSVASPNEILRSSNTGLKSSLREIDYIARITFLYSSRDGSPKSYGTVLTFHNKIQALPLKNGYAMSLLWISFGMKFIPEFRTNPY